MDNAEASQVTAQGFEILCLWSRNIAMLPLEDWLTTLNRAESIGPIIDPTAYLEYRDDPRSEVFKELLEKAVALKAVVMKAQTTLGFLKPE